MTADEATMAACRERAAWLHLEGEHDQAEMLERQADHIARGLDLARAT